MRTERIPASGGTATLPSGEITRVWSIIRLHRLQQIVQDNRGFAGSDSPAARSARGSRPSGRSPPPAVFPAASRARSPGSRAPDRWCQRPPGNVNPKRLRTPPYPLSRQTLPPPLCNLPGKLVRELLEDARRPLTVRTLGGDERQQHHASPVTRQHGGLAGGLDNLQLRRRPGTGPCAIRRPDRRPETQSRTLFNSRSSRAAQDETWSGVAAVVIVPVRRRSGRLPPGSPFKSATTITGSARSKNLH